MNTAGFYAEVANHVPAGALAFMNYGYAPPNEDYSWVRAGDLPYRYNLSLARLVLNGVPLREAKVLECGSGRGGNCLYLDRYTDAGAIYGMDMCEPHVRLCCSQNLSCRVQFICGDAVAIPFQPDSVDVLLNLESSHCYPDFERFLAEVRRVLKPGGYFAYADLWELSIFEYDWAARQRSLDSCGLILLRELDISDDVFRALQRDDGLSHIVRDAASATNAPLVGAILRANEAMRLTLALKQCWYRVMLMRKSIIGSAQGE